MNRSYRVVWSRARRAFVVVSELARSGGRASGATGGPALHKTVALTVGAVALALAGAPDAYAVCTLSGANVTCNGAANPLAPSYSNATSGLNVTVNTGATLGVLLGIGGTALTLTGSNVTLNNAGSIDPDIFGAISLLSSGAVIGNAAPSTVGVTNSGTIKGTSGLLGLNLADLTGLALAVQNGTGGTTTVSNSGTIASSALLGVTLGVGDMPVGAVYGGGQVSFTNSATGIINGRVAFQASGTPGTGNSFINAGQITGSVSLGAGGTNSFTARTGSSVSAGAGASGAPLGVIGLSLGFAPAGTVDGGVGGDSTLHLEQAPGGPSLGSISNPSYTDFPHLAVDSGDWTLSGASTATDAMLSLGAVANINNAQGLGTGTISSNGGQLETSAANLNVTNSVQLEVGGLNVQSANPLTLSGVLTGSGALIDSGGGALTVTGANSYAGGTQLQAGTLIVGNGTALGAGPIVVGGSATLDTNAAFTIANAIDIAAGTLTLGGSNATTFSGAITGADTLVKNGVSTITLTGIDTHSGGTQINIGTLAVGAGGSLSSASPITLAAGTTLDLSAATTDQTIGALSGDVASVLLGANTLTFGDATNASFAGVISGTGGIVKQGSGTETLTGASTYAGSTTINSGTLALSGNGLLPAANALTLANAGAAFDISAANGARSVGELSGVAGTTVLLGANLLSIGDATNQTFGGAITGTGSILKLGSGTETLTGASTYTGGTTIGAGTLALSASGALAATGAVDLSNAGSTLDLSGANGSRTIGALIGAAGSSIALGANTLTFGDTTNQVFNGSIGGTGGLTKQGVGTETLTAANTYTGGTTVNAGTLSLGAGASLASTGNMTLGAGATFDISASGANQTLGSLAGVGGSVALGANTLTFGNAASQTFGGSIGGTGGIVKQGSGTETLTGANTYTGGTTINAGTLALAGNGSVAGSIAVQLAAAGATFDISGAGANQTLGSLSGVAGSTLALGGNSLTFGDATDQTMAGAITGTGGLVKSGSGFETLGGANTYSGGTTLNAGGLIVGSNSALGTGTLTVGGASTLDSSAATSLGNNVVLNAGLTVLGSNDLILNGSISGTGGLTKDGLATLTLNGTDTYTGGTAINAGTLALGAGASLSANGVVDVATGATFDLSAGNGTQTFGTLTGGGMVNVGANALTIGDATNGVFGGSIGGTGSLVKVGAGTETLTGANSYTGGTTIDAGTLALGAGGSLAITGAVALNGAGTGFDISASSFFQFIGALSGSAGSTVTLGTNTLTFGDATDQVFGGAIVGTGGIVKQGNGTETLTGANTFTGGTTIAQGTLALGAGGSLAATGAVSLVLPAAAFDISAAGAGQTIGDLSGLAGSVILGANTLTFGTSTDQTFGGSISGAGGLVKQGSSTETLTGASTYTGATTINAGTLAFAGAGSLSSSSDVDLANAGASLDVSAATGTPTIGALAGVAGTSVALGANTLTLGSASNAAFAGTIGGTGGIVKQGSGTETLTGANTYTGGTTINAGTLALGAGGSVAASGAVQVAGAGATFDISGAAGGQTVGALSGVAGSAVALGGNSLTFGDATNQTLASTVTGTGGLVKEGSGAQTLSGANTYSGGTTLNAGGLIVGNNSALGTGALTVGGLSTLDSSAATSLANNVVLNAGLTVLGSNDLTLDGSISGTGALTKDGLATLTLNGTDTYTGGTSINAGTLALGAGASLAAFGVVNVATGATFDLSAGNGAQTFGTLTGGGTINLGANSLTLGGPTDGTYGGAIGGTGGLIKQGSGTETLTGANTFTGGTAIDAGTLALGAGGSLAPTGTVALNGLGTGFDISGSGADQSIGALSGITGTTVTLGANTLTFGDATNQTFGGTIGGTGGIVKQGNGTETLTGTNTYSGGTTINAGTLALGAGGSLAPAGGVSLATAGAGFDISASGADQTIGSLAGVSGTAVTLGANNLAMGDSTSQTFAGIIGGAGGLTKQGSGTEMLTGANTYTGGTTITAGTLALGAGGSLAAAGSVTLANAGSFDISGAGGNQAIGALSGSAASSVLLGANTLSFGDATNQNYAGTIGGSGGLTKTGSGVETLGGVNTYTGSTTISAGTLALAGAGSIAASSGLTDNGVFDISASTTGASVANLTGSGSVNLGTKNLTLTNPGGTFAGTFAGTGMLTKQGAGTLVLNGNSSAFAGSTEVAGGMLEVGDASTPSAVLGGDVVVDFGATLRGHGTIGHNVVNNGTVAPGGSIGTLTVGGNYTQSSTGTLAIEVSPTLASQLKVGGNAALAGNLAVSYDPGTYTAKTYTLVSAAGGVNGTFGSVTSTGAANIGALTPSIGYGANTVDLTLAGATSPTGTTVVAPTQTSIYTALGTAAILGAQAQNSAMLERLGGVGTLAGAAQTTGPSAWITASGTHAKVDGTNGEPGFQTQRYGFMAGVERTTGSNTMGVAAGYDHVNLQEQETGDSGKLDTLRASVYGLHSAGPVNLSATAGVGFDFLSQKRPFTIGTAQGDHTGQEFNLGGQASLPMNMGGLTLTPRLGLRYAYFHGNGFGENGASGQDLDVGNDTVQSLQPYTELTLDHAFGQGANPASVQLRVGYAYEVLNTNRSVSVNAQDGTLFNAPGANLPHGYLTAGFGVTLHPAKNLDVSAGFDALMHTSHASAQESNLFLRYHF